LPTARFSKKDVAITSLVLLVALAVFGFGLYQFLPLRHRSAYAVVRDISGRQLRVGSGRWQAIVVGSVENDAPLVHALELAEAARAHGDMRVGAVVFATDARPVLLEYVKRAQPLVPICSFQDNYYPTQAMLNLEDTRAQIFLFDPSSKLVFHGGKPRPSDVPLLLQRFLPLPEAVHAPLKLGDALPLTSVLNVRTLQRENAPVPPTLGIVFTGRCTECALETHLGTVKALEAAILRRAKDQNRTPALLFTSYFNPSKLRDRVSALGFTTGAYQILADVRSVDDLAERDAVDVLVIEMDKGGRITRLRPLNEFVQDLVEVKQ
jgi:hypothetical protein